MNKNTTRPVGQGGTNATRRQRLCGPASAAGGAFAAMSAQAAPLTIQESSKEHGRPIEPTGYGLPSKYEASVVRRRTDVLVNRQNFSDWSMTPLAQQHGILTPNGLFFERHHNGVPDIDPKTH